jgi:hypothetical protein
MWSAPVGEGAKRKRGLSAAIEARMFPQPGLLPLDWVKAESKTEGRSNGSSQNQSCTKTRRQLAEIPGALAFHGSAILG